MTFNPLDSKGNYSATSNNTKLVHIWYSKEDLGGLQSDPVPSTLYQM